MSDRFSRYLDAFLERALEIGGALLGIVITFAIAWGISWIARRYVEPLLSRQAFGRNGALLVGRLISILAFVGAVLVILGQMGANWTGLLTFLSAFTVAIGLALQDVLRNFFSGLMLLVERPFKVGDRVKVRDFEGEIQGIDIRTTLIRNAEGALVMVPNSVLFTEILINKSHYRTRRLDLVLTSGTLAIEEIERRIVASLASMEGVRKPIPAPYIRSSSTESKIMEISVMIESKPEVEERVMRTLIEELGDTTIERAET